jgi:hypothetical protein
MYSIRSNIFTQKRILNSEFQNFNYLGYEMACNIETEINNEVRKFGFIYGTTSNFKKANMKENKDNILQRMTVSADLYGCEM